MKKIFKKIVGFALFAVLMATTLSFGACAKLSEIGMVGTVEEVDEGKTQLYVGCWDGGLRTNWLTTMAKNFMEANKETEFEPGKKGIQVWVNPSKTYALDSFLSKVKDVEDDIIINEQVNYYALINSGAVMDLTKEITTPLIEYGENKSIADKMTADDVNFYGVGEGENKKYYGVPWYTSVFGLNYDVDLFDENFYYFTKTPSDDDPFVSTLTEVRSAGPDGKYCEICANNGYKYDQHVSCDDGLPATFDEFFILCDKMVEDGVTPIIWSGEQKGYLNSLLSSMSDSIDGYENAILNYNLNGTASTLVKFENGNPVMNDGKFVYEEPTEINNTNGYMLRRQSGKYYALEFLYRLLNTRNSDNTTKYIDELDATTSKHTIAQSKFLLSRFSTASKPIAMLSEGTWWYNEASGMFDNMKSIPGAGKTERRIGLMPFPKPYEGYQEDATPSFTNTWITSIIIRKNMDASRVNAAKAFFRYMHTDANLSLFVKEAHCMRPFDFKLEDKAQCSYFLQRQYEFFTGNNYKTVNSWSSNPLVINNLGSFVGNQNSKVGKSLHKFAIDGLRDKKSTALQYFVGLSTQMDKSNWDNSYKNYFNN